ncbi:MAG: hypothetical protein Ta2B_14310 [Termitinemataceae bacterium]|nr:MAG: hypothetical protein Ta2B_14310 [Termitinemataceae bacterium]
MANNPENVIGKGNRFSSTNQPENRGRKPSKIKKLIKKYDLPKSDVDAIIQNLLFDHTVGELSEIAQDDDKKSALPAFAAYLMVLLEKSTSKGDPRVLSYFLDRVYGKPVQTMDINQPADDLPEGLNDLAEYEKYLDDKAKVLDEPNVTGKNTTKKDKGKMSSS